MSVAKNMQALQSGRIMASAEVLWQALETQRDTGINWMTIEMMDVSLAKLLPFTRHTIKNRTAEGLYLLNAFRRFCPDKCTYMLEQIEFPDVMEWLHREGYGPTRDAFIMKACAYARAQQALIYYAR